MSQVSSTRWKQGVIPAALAGAVASLIFLGAIVNYRKTSAMEVGLQTLLWFAIPAAIVQLLYATGVVGRSASPGGKH